MKFKWKVFTSLSLTLSFFLASVSGIALYLTPRGRIAHWTDWTLLGLTKDGWEALHLTSILIMLIMGLLHLFLFNWKPFLGYLGKKAKSGLRYPKEIAISLVLFLLMFFGTIYEMPGVMAVTHFRDYIKDTYEVEKDQPPIPHAENLTIAEFSKKIMNKPTSEVLVLLKQNGWEANGEDEIILHLAERYSVSPQKIMNRINKTNISKTEENHIDGEGKHNEQGKGYGRMLLKKFCDNNEISMPDAKKELQRMGAKNFNGKSKLKDISTQVGLHPSELAGHLIKECK